ncbi:glycosyltransferase family 39 protein [Patescibacteria group bacterium]|nr:glycosyltransferase family 39 protein [Patescibacteria group bacterium]
MADLPTATIVIPTFKRPGLALKLAKQIRRLYPKLQIVIVDQENPHPPDHKTLAKLTVEYHNLQHANTSLAKNLGIKQTRGEVVIFFDDDVEVTKNTIANHLRQYADQRVVGVAGRVINDGEEVPKNTDQPTGNTNLLGTKFVYRFWSTKNQPVDFVYGCNMSFRSAALRRTHGFDPGFPKIFEEVDLSKRIRQFGRIVFSPDAMVYHHKAGAGGIRPEERKNKQKLIFENYGRYLAKNVVFPFSLISLALRARTALSANPTAVINLFSGFFSGLMSLLKQNYVLIFVFLLIGFLRLWKVPDFFLFTFSEEWQGTLAWEQVKNFHPIWIGVSQANINYYLGPGFIYLNYLLFLVKKGDVAVLAYFSALLGIITTAVLYFVTKNLFDRRTALFAGTFYGCSTLINYYDRRFWNPSFIPLMSLLFVYGLIRADKNSRWYILVAALTGAAFHFHLLLLLFVLPALYSLVHNFRKIRWQTWIAMALIYLTIVSPLIVFDLNHNFDNLLAPYKIIIEGKKTGLYALSPTNMLNHVNSLWSTFGRVWFVKLHSNLQDIALETNTSKIPGNILLSLLSLIALLWFFIKNRRNGYQIFFISIASILLAYIVYPSYNPEYYLMGFLTILTICVGFWLGSLPKQAAYLIIGLFMLANLATVLTTTDDYGLTMKERFIAKTMRLIKGREFSLETTGPLPNPQYAYAGWRLLFKIYGKTPSRSSVDSVLGWIYPDEISKNEPKLHVVVSESPAPIKHEPVLPFREGDYYGYVYE